MHGDKVEVAGLELRFADDSKRGVTEYTSLEAVSPSGGSRRAGAAMPTLASGGRLVSLVDGKEYPVPEGGLTIGRDAGCDVVVPKNEVSRRHAELRAMHGLYDRLYRLQAGEVTEHARAERDRDETSSTALASPSGAG
jgi:hypothetical protein